MQGVFKANSRLEAAVRLFEGEIHGPGVQVSLAALGLLLDTPVATSYSAWHCQF